MARTPRPKAYCTFCKKARVLTKSGRPMGHTKRGNFGCPGMTKVAKECESCDGTGQIKTIYDTYLDAPCNVCMGEKRIIQ